MDIIQSFGIVFLLNITEYIISPFTNIIITKSLTVSDYGSYNLLISMSGLVFSFFTLGLSQYNCKIVPGRKIEEQYSILGQSITCEFVSASIGIIIIGIIFQKKIDNNLLLCFFIIKTLLSVLINEILRFLGYQKKNVTKSIISFLDAKLWFLPLIVLFFIKKISISNIFIIQVINSTIIIIILLFIINQSLLFKNLLIKKQFITEVLKISISFVFIDVGMYLLEMASRYILTIEASMESVGYFSFSYSWIALLMKFSMLLVYLFQPYFSEAYYKKNDSEIYLKKYQRYTAIAFNFSLYIILCASIFLLFFYEQIVLIIGKVDYVKTYHAYVAMFCLPFFMFLAYFFQIILLLAGKAKIFPICYFIMGLVNIILNILLVRRFDYLGAAIVCTISYLFLTILFLYFCPKKLINHLMTLKDVILAILILLITIVNCSVFKSLIVNRNFALLISFCLELIIALIVLYIRRADLRYLKNNS